MGEWGAIFVLFVIQGRGREVGLKGERPGAYEAPRLLYVCVVN